MAMKAQMKDGFPLLMQRRRPERVVSKTIAVQCATVLSRIPDALENLIPTPLAPLFLWTGARWEQWP